MKREEYTKYKQINNYNKGRNNTTYSYQTVQYSKRVENKTTSNTSVVNNSRYKQYTSMTNKNNLYNKDNQSIKSNSFTTNKSAIG